MASHLQSLPTLIKGAFPDRWWEKYNFAVASIEEMGNLNEQTDSFKKDVESAKDSLFNELNLSVLTGEYVDVDDFEAQVERAGDALTGIIQPFPIPEIQELIANELSKNFADCIKHSLGLYRRFYTSVKLKISFSSKYFLADVDPEIEEQVLKRGFFNDDSYKYLTFFSANLKIARLDLFLESNQDDLNRLFGFSQELQNGQLSGRKYSKVLLGKCNYLINKWVLRKRLFNERSVWWVRNYKEEEFNIDVEDPYEKWIEYIKCHYQMNSEWEGIVEENRDSIKEKNLFDLTLLEIHSLIKFYKDVSKSKSLLREIKDELHRRYEKSKESERDSLFRRYSLSICLNYAANNEFSLLLEDEDISGSYANQAYEDLLTLQTKTRVKNFFPQYKFLGYLVKKLSAKYHHHEAVSNIAELRSLINNCKNVIRKYDENIKWSRDHYNYVWQMPYEECELEVEMPGSRGNIFIASTFVLPLIQTAYVEEFDELKKKVLNFETSIEAIENIEKELKKIDGLESSYQQLKEDVNKNFKDKEAQLREKEVKYIETIGIFAAIVTFVATSISGYKFVTTAYQAGLFTISLCTSFCFFAFLLMVIFKGYERYKRVMWFFAIIGLITIVSWYLLCHGG